MEIRGSAPEKNCLWFGYEVLGYSKDIFPLCFGCLVDKHGHFHNQVMLVLYLRVPHLFPCIEFPILEGSVVSKDHFVYKSSQ